MPSWKAQGSMPPCMVWCVPVTLRTSAFQVSYLLAQLQRDTESTEEEAEDADDGFEEEMETSEYIEEFPEDEEVEQELQKGLQGSTLLNKEFAADPGSSPPSSRRVPLRLL